MSRPILSVSNLIAGYGNTSVIKGIDFEVYEGEIVGLVGPNGAGKTTFLETIAGTVKPRAGKIFWRDKRIDALSVMARRKLGIMLVPQEAYMFPMMPVKANLEVSGVLNRDRDTRELMAYVHEIFPVLKAREKQIANTLSGGERKMLAVGMGIVSSAKLIMIDEPSIGLAPRLVTKLLENLKKIKEDTGRTLVLAEQNVKILNIADRIYGLEAGETRFCDRTQNLDESMVAELYMGK
ncbi:MAG: ATP-binding cassette domain-containing protein [Deltaproteobacteria bacterium]|nr:ATP-binding cassette domain-containing protein [Deltaproteobacteria bacterium]